MKTQSEQKGVSEGESQRCMLRVDRGRVAQRFAGHRRGFDCIRAQETDSGKPEAKGHGVFRKERKEKRSSNFITIYS